MDRIGAFTEARAQASVMAATKTREQMVRWDEFASSSPPLISPKNSRRRWYCAGM